MAYSFPTLVAKLKVCFVLILHRTGLICELSVAHLMACDSILTPGTACERIIRSFSILIAI